MTPTPLLTPSPSSPPTPVATPLLTIGEFMARYENKPYELVRGRLKEVPMSGNTHGYACAALTRFIANFVDDHDLGRVMGNDTRLATGPATVRGGDVLFYSWDRMPRDAEGPPGLYPQAPDLIAEVRSPTDAWTEVFAKVEEYFAVGVRAVLVLDPDRKVVSVCRPGPTKKDFAAGDTLTVEDVLPGFAVAADRLFFRSEKGKTL